MQMPASPVMDDTRPALSDASPRRSPRSSPTSDSAPVSSATASSSEPDAGSSGSLPAAGLQSQERRTPGRSSPQRRVSPRLAARGPSSLALTPNVSPAAAKQHFQHRLASHHITSRHHANCSSRPSQATAASQRQGALNTAMLEAQAVTRSSSGWHYVRDLDSNYMPPIIGTRVPRLQTGSDGDASAAEAVLIEPQPCTQQDNGNILLARLWGTHVKASPRTGRLPRRTQPPGRRGFGAGWLHTWTSHLGHSDQRV